MRDAEPLCRHIIYRSYDAAPPPKFFYSASPFYAVLNPLVMPSYASFGLNTSPPSALTFGGSSV